MRGFLFKHRPTFHSSQESGISSQHSCGKVCSNNILNQVPETTSFTTAPHHTLHQDEEKGSYDETRFEEENVLICMPSTLYIRSSPMDVHTPESVVPEVHGVPFCSGNPPKDWFH